MTNTLFYFIAFCQILALFPLILLASNNNNNNKQCSDSIKQWESMNLYSNLPNIASSSIQTNQAICSPLSSSPSSSSSSSSLSTTTLSPCCNLQQENQMLSLSAQKVESFYRRILQNIADTLSHDATALTSFYRSNIESTRDNLHIMFSKTYGYQYNSNKDFFFAFFRDLQDYLDGKRSNIVLLLEAFFNQLRERMARLMLAGAGNDPNNIGGGAGQSSSLSSSITVTEPQINCIIQKLKEIKAFGIGPDTIRTQLLRSYPIARLFVNSLNLAAEVLANVIQKTPILQQCAAHHMRTQHCMSCYGAEVIPPCQEYCVAVMTACFSPYQDLTRMWPLFMKTMKSAAEKMEQSQNLPNVNEPLQVHISEAIMELHTTWPKKRDQLLQECSSSSAAGGGGNGGGGNRMPFNFNQGNRKRRQANDYWPPQQQQQQGGFGGGDGNAWQIPPNFEDISRGNVGGAGRGGIMQNPSIILNNLVKRVKNEISSYDKIWEAGMGICDDGMYGVSTMSQPPCWNGSAVGEFLTSNWDSASLSSIPSVISPATLASASAVIAREGRRLQDMTARLTMALRDLDPDVMVLDGTQISGSGSGGGGGGVGGLPSGGGGSWPGGDFIPPSGPGLNNELPTDLFPQPPKGGEGDNNLPFPDKPSGGGRGGGGGGGGGGKGNKKGKGKGKGRIKGGDGNQSPGFPLKPQPLPPSENNNRWGPPTDDLRENEGSGKIPPIDNIWQPPTPAPRPITTTTTARLPFPPDLAVEGSGDGTPPIRPPIDPPIPPRPFQPTDDEDQTVPTTPNRLWEPPGVRPPDNIPLQPLPTPDDTTGGGEEDTQSKSDDQTKGHIHVDLNNINDLLIHLENVDMPIPPEIWLPPTNNDYEGQTGALIGRADGVAGGSVHGISSNDAPKMATFNILLRSGFAFLVVLVVSFEFIYSCN